MNVKHLVSIKDDNELRSRLQDYLNEERYELDLDDFCRRGGNPEFDELFITGFERTAAKIECTLDVRFSEVITTSCSDVDINHSKSCIFEVSIDESGDIVFTNSTELWDGEEYGEDVGDEFDPGWDGDENDDGDDRF